LQAHERVYLLTDIEADPGTGFGAFVIDGMEATEFAAVLLSDYGISVKAFAMEEDETMKGIHLSPGLANTVEEIDRFVEATRAILTRKHNTFKQAG
jgi:selenocysteine lyase/cysteine desulfurase